MYSTEKRYIGITEGALGVLIPSIGALLEPAIATDFWFRAPI
ncbi:MAG: hypothetical protein AAF915_29175 [Cyanobacteria bacterium P01_D01_bin.50]